MLDYLIPYLTRTFSFDPNSPLLFTQFYFWGFFAVVFAFLTLIKNRILLRNAFLFATSMFFYYKTSGSYVCILIFCVVANFFIGKWIERAEEHWKKKLWMIIIVIIDLLVLCYYKYSYFFLDALYDFTGIELHVYNFFAAASNKLFDTNSLVDTIILPVGISFFTFQAISSVSTSTAERFRPSRTFSISDSTSRFSRSWSQARSFAPTSSFRSFTASTSCRAAPSASPSSGF